MKIGVRPSAVALGIAILLLSVAWAPYIGAMNDTRELTVELCGPTGASSHTVTLRQADLERVTAILADANARLNATGSGSEKIGVLYDAVQRLHPYGVFGDLSVSQAQTLVTRWYRPEHPSLAGNGSTNSFCIVTGRTNLTLTTHRHSSWIMMAGAELYNYGLANGPGLLEQYPFLIFTVPVWLFVCIGMVLYGFVLNNRADFSPLAFGDIFGIGFYDTLDNETWYATGWVRTTGTAGNVSWDGDLVGNLPGLKLMYSDYLEAFPAIWGFSGIKIWMNKGGTEKSYMGCALKVGLDERQD